MGSAELPLDFVAIAEDDIEVLTGVMTRAFDDDARKHQGKERGGPEGYDNGEFFRKWLFGYEQSVGYKVLAESRVIGGIVVWILPGGGNVLGTIFVDPEMQDQGVGARTWSFIERTYPEARTWSLATPEWATKNHHFYRKCGFSRVDSDPIIPQEEGLAIYRKEMAAVSPDVEGA